ncbi:glycerophosphodiester phosphodiesterase GDPD1, chloroplastic-like isoform X1 [Malania oleifera]|uniref:glycerophosphodiester phosphodiesterase GDPD1, chloroplastic-like isoform X1 n=2 Tax=Malania oleifera TaxID=397392 RepID=UPI0025ADE2F5|nr:glycerophosphodiester phosphodiesterase GDPD1, chloroplastic-like isoform X1 [Malania oleifera]
MALLKAVHVSDVPNLDQVPENASVALYSLSNTFSEGVESVCNGGDGGRKSSRFRIPKFMVIGHRGSGMNMMQSSDQRMKAIKENSVLSFNAAGKSDIHFIEFDVQVTKDDYPVIFHDNFILAEEKGSLIEKRVTDLTLAEFLSHGPQREPINVGKPLFRKIKDGRIFKWNVEVDDPLCTLQEVFQKVEHSLGFNIELKFDDNIVYKEEYLAHVLQLILQVVFESAKDRPIIFSSFQPDAARLIRKMQSIYPVFFLTNGGSEIYRDTRRNSLDEAIKLCLESGLQGIVSEVKAIFRNSGEIARIKESNLSLISYGQLNNVAEAVHMQYIMGVEGVIVDLVQEVTVAVSGFTNPAAYEKVKEDEEGRGFLGEERQMQVKAKPHFSHHELSFLLKLISELMIQH